MRISNGPIILEEYSDKYRRIWKTTGQLKDCIKELKRKHVDADLLSLADVSIYQQELGLSRSICRTGTYVEPWILYFPQKETHSIILRDSPLISHISEASQANQEGREWLVSPELISQITNYSTPISKEGHLVYSDKMASDSISIRLFGGADLAQSQGEFLIANRIPRFQILLEKPSVVDAQPGPFARQFYLESILAGSKLRATQKNLHHNPTISHFIEILR